MSPYKHKILFCVTGSIAAYKAAFVVSRLRQMGHQVKVACSESSLKFIGAMTWEGLSGSAPAIDLYQAGSAMDHIHLARWADLIVICPATANTINRLAAGLTDNIIEALLLSRGRTPAMLFPAMNHEMYLHPATQDSIKRLTQFGLEILPPEEGSLACGESGPGRLMEPEMILAQIRRKLGGLKANKGRLLITSGGTSEPIDQVRTITNFSTGRTGAHLADLLSELGWEVVLLRAQNSIRPEVAMEEHVFDSVDSLKQALQRILSLRPFSAVIHAAAVSDYRLAKAREESKISSDLSTLQLNLVATEKLLGKIKSWSSGSPPLVMGFKLKVGATIDERRASARKLLESRDVDFIVANDLKEIDQSQHAYELISRLGILSTGGSKAELANSIDLLLSQQLKMPQAAEVPHDLMP